MHIFHLRNFYSQQLKLNPNTCTSGAMTLSLVMLMQCFTQN